MTRFDTPLINSYWSSTVTMVLCHAFSEIFNEENTATWNPGHGLIKVIEVVPFNRFGVVSYYCPIVTLSVRYSPSKNTVTSKPRLGITEGHWKWHYLIHHLWFPMMFHSNYGLMSCLFRRYSMSKNIATLKSRSGVNQGHW